MCELFVRSTACLYHQEKKYSGAWWDTPVSLSFRMMRHVVSESSPGLHSNKILEKRLYKVQLTSLAAILSTSSFLLLIHTHPLL